MGRRVYTKKQKDKLLEAYEFGELNGLMNSVVPYEAEDNPSYIEAEAEKILNRNNGNARIIFGKDRMADIESGFGGLGKPNSNAIDMVVGMGSSLGTLGNRTLKKTDYLDKNPFTDAARIYISQRTDIDGHFGVTEGKIYDLDRKQGVSGAAMKADTVLVLGRRNVKIKAGQSHGDGFPMFGEKDSHGTRLPDARIDLIADAPLEPMVRGDKMVSCIKNIYNQIQSNRKTIIKLISHISQLQLAVALHTHEVAGLFAINSSVLVKQGFQKMPEYLLDLTTETFELSRSAIEELNCVVIPNGGKYILSKNVFTS